MSGWSAPWMRRCMARLSRARAAAPARSPRVRRTLASSLITRARSGSSPGPLAAQQRVAPLEEIRRGLVEPQAGVDAPHDAEQAGSQLGLIGQVGVQALHALVEQLARRDLLRLRPSRARELEEPDQELGGGLGACRRPPGPRRLPRARAQAGGQRNDQEGRGRRGQAVPAEEAARPVSERVGPRAHRLVREVATQVLGQRLHGRVSLRGALLERLRHDVVEVAAQRAAEPPGRRGAPARRVPS